MTRVLHVIALACAATLATACDPEPSPTGPTGEVATFSAELRSSNQPGIVVGAEANGTGTATMSIVISRGTGGAISNAIATVSVALSGYPSTTIVNSAEVRKGDAGSQGTTVFDLGVSTGAVPIAGGTGSFAISSVPLPAPTVQEMLNAPSSFFLTFSTVAHPNGVARGQFIRQ